MEIRKYRRSVEALLASLASGLVFGACFYWGRECFGWRFYWGSETHELRVLDALQVGLLCGFALFVFLFRRLRRFNSPPSTTDTFPNAR
jgi:hypothetical protein